MAHFMIFRIFTVQKHKPMKYTSTLFFGLLFALFLAACSGNPQKAGPKPTAEAFLMAMNNGDYDRAKEYCTPDSRDKLDWMSSFSKLGANPNAEPFKIVREELSGDYARVYYTQGDDKEKLLKLRNTTGKWEVIASKTDISEEESEGMESFGDMADESADNFNKSMEDFSKSLEDLGEELENGFDMDEDEDDEDLALKYKSLREGKSPAEIASGFLTALKYNDYDGAKKYASSRTADVLDMKSGLSDDKNFGEFEIGKTVEEGEYATVHYTDEEGKDKTVKLGVDKEGNWEVIMTKSDFNDAG